MIRNRYAKALLFILIFILAMFAQTVQQNKAAQRNLEYEQLQAEARACQGMTGIKEEIVGSFVNQDWDVLMERSITQSKNESEEIFGYVSEINQKLEAGKERALEN